MNSPGGLLLAVPHLFALPFSVLWVGLQKSTELNLDVKHIFAGSHTTAGDALGSFLSLATTYSNGITNESLLGAQCTHV
jgi:hypothetical protein